MDFSDILKHDQKFRYMLLSRMKSDCDYYLGNGNRFAGHLWGQNEVNHIGYMKALWESFGENEKPEWLTMEQILDYEKELATEHHKDKTCELSAAQIESFPQQIIDLIAIYEEMHNIPSDKRVTSYFGDYGLHVFKTGADGAAADQISASLSQALSAVGMTMDEFMAQKDNFIYRGEIKRLMTSQMQNRSDGETLSDKIAKATSVAEHGNKNSSSPKISVQKENR